MTFLVGDVMRSSFNTTVGKLSPENDRVVSKRQLLNVTDTSARGLQMYPEVVDMKSR